MKTYAFIDASNIIYGTRDEGWKVDFRKLFKYLRERYKCKKIYYFAGLDPKNIKQQNFYKLLEKIGYDLVIKNIKIYTQADGSRVRKANCDVDLTFYAMRDKDLFNKGVFLTGDGDFQILLEYFIEREKKEIIVIASGKRTSKEITRLLGGRFTEIKSLKKLLNYKKSR